MAEKKENTLTIDLDKLTPVFYLVLIVLALVVGVLWQKVSDLENSSSPGVAGNAGTGQAQPSGGIVRGKLSPEQASKLAPVSSDENIRGSEDAQVYLVEYSDLQCPYCSAFHDTARQVVEDYDGQVAWVYRHFPLDSIHPKARPAAIAAECVARVAGNDAFWNFADSIFANQESALADIGATAASVGAEGPNYESCLEDESVADLVERHYQDGLNAGVTGTPGNFVVNNSGEVWYVPGAVDASTLSSTVDEALGS